MRIFLFVAIALCFLNFASAGTASATGDQTASADRECNLICQEVGQLTNTYCSFNTLTVDYSRTGLSLKNPRATSDLPSCSSLA
jgi:hypothetical protein